MIALPLLAVAQAKLSGPDLIRKMQAAVRAASPVTGVLQATDYDKRVTWVHFKAMYPGRYEIKAAPDGFMEFHGTGSAHYLYYPWQNSFLKTDQPFGMMPPYLFVKGFERAFGDENIYDGVQAPKLRKFNGKPAYGIALLTPEQAGPSYDVFYIDPKTYLPLGFDSALEKPTAKKRYITHHIYKNIITHAPLTEKDFDWTPPKGAKGS